MRARHWAAGNYCMAPACTWKVVPAVWLVALTFARTQLVWSHPSSSAHRSSLACCSLSMHGVSLCGLMSCSVQDHGCMFLQHRPTPARPTLWLRPPRPSLQAGAWLGVPQGRLGGVSLWMSGIRSPDVHWRSAPHAPPPTPPLTASSSLQAVSPPSSSPSLPPAPARAAPVPVQAVPPPFTPLCHRLFLFGQCQRMYVVEAVHSCLCFC